mmetsp:Transcript_38406/g.62246  ORF Transcript_38406/g.62246 Transcript_38406/m.62246 type:complete len:307 (+) Transcript_38406:65-985(+)
MVTVYTTFIRVRYLASRLSLAYLFDRLQLASLIIIAGVVAYSTHSFWIRQNVYREQPTVSYASQYILLVDLGSSQLFFTPNATLNRLLGDSSRAALVKVTQQDSNNDGIFDYIYWNAQIPLVASEAVVGVSVLLEFNFRLTSYAQLSMTSYAYYQFSSGAPLRELSVIGNLLFQQRYALSVTSPSVAFNSSVIVVSSPPSLQDMNLFTILYNLSSRPVLTYYQNTLPIASTGAAPGDLYINLTIQNPPQNILYQPDTWEVLKYAWIQYAAMLLIGIFFSNIIRDFVYQNQIFSTRIKYDELKPHQF